MTAKRMTTGDVLHAAVLDDPDDDTTAFAFADWLEESGGPAELDRAAFIRAQRRLERIRDDPERAELESQVGGLLDAHRSAWLACLPAELHRNVTFRGGFAREVSLRGPQLVAHGDDLFAAQPITDVIITGTLSNQSATELATREWWARVRRLRLQSCVKQSKPLVSLLSNPHLVRLREFEADNCDLGTKGTTAIASWPGLRSVEKFRLMFNRLNAESMRLLLRSPNLGSPRSFLLTGNLIDDEAIAEVARCERLAELQVLWLPQNQIGPAGASALARSTVPAELVSLSLLNNPIGDEGALALLDGAFPKLNLLWLPRGLSEETTARMRQRFPGAIC